MEGVYFKIRYDAMCDFYERINEKMAEWDEKLDQIQSKYNEFIESDSFQGEGVDCAKVRLKETHDTLLDSFRKVTIEYRVKYMKYKMGYYLIDENESSSFPEEVFKLTSEKLTQASNELKEISSGIGKSLCSVSDLISLPNPGIITLEATIEGVKEKIQELSNDVAVYENNQLATATGDLESLIHSLGQVIREYLNCERNVTSYTNGDVFNNSGLDDLREKTKRCEEYIIENPIYSEEVLCAIEKLNEYKEEYDGFKKKQEEEVYTQEYLDKLDENGCCYMYGIEVYEAYQRDINGEYMIDSFYNEHGTIELRDLGFEFDVSGYDVSNMTQEEYVNLMGPIWELSYNHKTKQDVYEDLRISIAVLSAMSGVYGIETLLAGYVVDTSLDAADVAVSALSGDKAGVVTGILCMAMPELLDLFAKGGKLAAKNLDGLYEGISDAKRIEMLDALEKEGIKDIEDIVVDQDVIKIYSKEKNVYEVPVVKEYIEGSSKFVSKLNELDAKGYTKFLERTDGIFASETDAQKAFEQLSNGNFEEFAKNFTFYSPEDGAVFWSKNQEAARNYAKTFGGTIMEDTQGGKVLNGWDWLSEKLPSIVDGHKTWGTGSIYDQKPLWQAVSSEFADGVTGKISYVHPEDVFGEVWSDTEYLKIIERIRDGKVTGIEEVFHDAAK